MDTCSAGIDREAVTATDADRRLIRNEPVMLVQRRVGLGDRDLFFASADR